MAVAAVADGHGHRDRLPGPGVLIVDVNVGAADRGLVNLDQHVVVADFRLSAPLHPDTALGLALHQRSHCN